MHSVLPPCVVQPTPVLEALKRSGISRCCDALECPYRRQEPPLDSVDAVCCAPAATELASSSSVVESSRDASEDGGQIDEDPTTTAPVRTTALQ
ncbi:hypothetical protein HPB50_002245 [Hyalomma asiaticum]|uniref:Uncharacterized protein n=1 Tax=Hyalomma asiaticum TaxID=266040 RepID=A0ACB7TDG3_HYAAI|nr:hypothetical protein HPB50_002245 [Hyalomma asiaticum]